MPQNHLFKAIFCLLLWALSANYLLAAQGGEFLQKYDQAVKLYNENKMEQAYKIFDELYFEKPDDNRVNFYLGRCALELKLYDDAMSAFERVLLMEPQHIRSRMELARVYFEQQQYEQAEEEFKRALEQNLPPEVAAKIQLYLKAIEESRRRSFINGTFIFGLQHDTNVNSSIGNKEYMIPSGLRLPGEKARVDMAAVQAVALNHIYDFGEKDGFYWQSSAILYAMSYGRTTMSNIKLVGFNTGPGYRSEKYDILLPFAADRVEYGLVPLMYTFGAAPKVTIKLSDSFLLDASYSYKNKFYYYNNWSRNAAAHELTLGIKKMFADSGSMISAAAIFSRDIERYSDGASNAGAIGRTDVNNNASGIRVEYFRPLLKDLDMQLGYSVRKSEYPQTDMLFLVPKKEVSTSYSIGLFKKISESSILNLTYTILHNDSNLESSVYKKNTTALSYIKSF